MASVRRRPGRSQRSPFPRGHPGAAVGAPLVFLRPRVQGFRQDPPLPIAVEVAESASADDAALAERIRARVREALTVATEITLVPYASLPRTTYKARLVDWSAAASA